MSLRIYLFDHLRIADDAGGQPRSIRTRAQLLLAFLLLNRHRSLSREQVAFTLWPDGPEPRSLGMLRRALSDLRAALPSSDDEAWIVASDTSLSWNRRAPVWIDIDAFQDAINQGTPAALHRAIELFTGELLAGWDIEWITAERERLGQLHVDTLRRLVAHHHALGQYDSAISLARRAIAHDPLSEAAHRDLISALYSSGDRAAALAAYDQLHDLLEDEIGVEPMVESQALRAAIVAGAPLPPRPSATRSRRTSGFGSAAPPEDLVGRDEELARLRGLWEAVQSGSGKLVMLGGEAGAGKSHLTRAFTGQIAAGGGLPLVGHCYEFEQALPYQAVVESLRSAATLLRHSDFPTAHRSTLARLAPDVLGVSGLADTDPDPLTADPRAQLFEALWQAFVTVSRGQPLLLVIEDVHWAAKSTMDWLTYIAPRLAQAPVLVVVTHRTDEAAAMRPLARLQRRLARTASVTAIPVPPLTPSAHQELVARLSGLPDEIARPIADRLFTDTAGNPFFLHEIIRGMFETGQLEVRQGRWVGHFVDAAGDIDLPLPAPVRDLIGARVERLDQRSRTFIQVAAVAGRVFDYETVQHAIGWDDETALNALEDVLERGFVAEPDGQGGFAFGHHLLQEVIYAAMTPPRRVFWHRKLARSIQTAHPDDVESLAHHFDRAGHDNEARLYYTRAADRAHRFAALDDAARYYRAALDRWPQADREGRAELLYNLSQCQWVLSELHAARDTLQKARDLFDALGDRRRVGDIDRTIGRVYWELNDREASLAHYHRALEVLEPEPESVELARAISSISQMHMLASDYAEAIAWGERALALAERLGAEDVAVHAQTNIGLSLIAPEDSERSLAMLRDSLNRAVAGNFVHDAMRTYVGVGEQLLSLGRYAESQETYEKLLVYARRVQSDLFTGIAVKALVQVEWLVGHWGEALNHRRELLEHLRLASQSHLATVWANRVLGTLHNDVGQPELAVDLLEPGLAAARSAAELQTTVPHLAEMGRAYAGLGRPSDAALMFYELVSWMDRSPNAVYDCIGPLLAACRWFILHAGPTGASAIQTCLSTLQHWTGVLGTAETHAAFAEARGLALVAGGDLGEAARQFEASIEYWRTITRPYDELRVLVELVNILLHNGDVAGAAALTDQALAIGNLLAAQLTDAGFNGAFRNSPLLRTLGNHCSQRG